LTTVIYREPYRPIRSLLDRELARRGGGDNYSIKEQAAKY
jgi:hypothetical protein